MPASGAHSHASEITVARRTVRGQSCVHAHYSEPESKPHVAVASPRPTVLAASWHGVPWTPSASDMPLVLLVCLPYRENPGHAMYTDVDLGLDTSAEAGRGPLCPFLLLYQINICIAGGSANRPVEVLGGERLQPEARSSERPLERR